MGLENLLQQNVHHLVEDCAHARSHRLHHLGPSPRPLSAHRLVGVRSPHFRLTLMFSISPCCLFHSAALAYMNRLTHCSVGLWFQFSFNLSNTALGASVIAAGVAELAGAFVSAILIDKVGGIRTMLSFLFVLLAGH